MSGWASTSVRMPASSSPATDAAAVIATAATTETGEVIEQGFTVQLAVEREVTREVSDPATDFQTVAVAVEAENPGFVRAGRDQVKEQSHRPRSRN
ncbi:MAG: hypothetical protein IPK93_10160 [Solirubrobacterales bacterium]|nr:hypothetical protein [Solirubrobacterales bacterium]